MRGPEDKAELLERIDRYRAGSLPLAAPLTLLRQDFLHYTDPYMARQTYLHPHPAEEALRAYG